MDIQAKFGVIDFMSKRRVTMGISMAITVLAILSLVVNGIKWGLDFTGGTQVEIQAERSLDLNQVRELLATEGGYTNFEVVYFGSERDVLVRIQESDEDLGGAEQAGQTGDRVTALIRAMPDVGRVDLLRSEYVGSVVGEELREQGGMGMLVALIMIMIYIALRFQFKFAVGAVVALVRDVIITLGFFSVLQLDFDLTVLAGLLAVIGYSLNDTIVIFDRIRENFRVMRRATPAEVINSAITVTLSRTIVTSGTTLLVLLSLFLFGGESVRGFSTALIIGVIMGTYSSVFVAGGILMKMNVSKEDLMPPARDEELDAIP